MFVFMYFPGLESICLKFKYFQEAWEPWQSAEVQPSQVSHIRFVLQDYESPQPNSSKMHHSKSVEQVRY